jgi:hypothetical protein
VIGQGTGAGTGAIQATSVDVVSSTEITAVTGGGAKAGTFSLYVTTSGGTNAANGGDDFTYSNGIVPTVTAVSPNTGPTSGGTDITITGTGFVAGATVTARTTTQSGTPPIPATNVDVVSSTEITAVTGGGAEEGTYSLFVTTSGGTSADNSGDHFSYFVPPPAVTKVSPNSGPTSGGTAITITGTGFNPGFRGSVEVVIGQGNGTSGAIAATNVDVVSSTEITATTGGPALPGTFSLYVTTPNGTSTGNSGDDFTYTNGPTVTEVSPDTGPTTGGTAITITGTGFVTGATVVIGQGNGAGTGAIQATSVDVVSSTEITAVTGGGAKAGTFSLYVTIGGGTSAGNSGDDFTYTS